MTQGPKKYLQMKIELFNDMQIESQMKAYCLDLNLNGWDKTKECGDETTN